MRQFSRHVLTELLLPNHIRTFKKYKAAFSTFVLIQEICIFGLSFDVLSFDVIVCLMYTRHMSYPLFRKGKSEVTQNTVTL